MTSTVVVVLAVYKIHTNTENKLVIIFKIKL